MRRVVQVTSTWTWLSSSLQHWPASWFETVPVFTVC